jgi:thioredoxin 1
MRIPARPQSHVTCDSVSPSLSINLTAKPAQPKGSQLMASANTIEVTDENFEAEILKAETPVLVDFWAVWCGPCRQVAPSVEALATEYEGKLKVGKMNVDDHQQVPQKYGIRSIPTLLVFKGGQVVGQIVGAVPKSKLEDEIKKHI